MKRRDFMTVAALGLAPLPQSRVDPNSRKSARYRVAIMGRTGQGDYGHGLDVVWNDISKAQVVAVSDPDPEGRSAAPKRTGAPRSYADYREMLERERPHIVSVAPRWLECHRDMVLACADFGCHVFLEKPFCQDLEQADEMVAAFDRRNLKLAIAHQTRYSPVVARLKTAIQDGLLGDVLELRGRGKEDRRGGGEDLMVLGTHIMDLMRLLAGDPEWCAADVRAEGHPVTARDVRNGAEGIGPLAGDEIHAVYRFGGAAMGYFSTHHARHGSPERYGLHIYGSKGIVTMTMGSLPEVWFMDDPTWQPGRDAKRWKRITSAGLGQPEPLTDASLGYGNRLIAQDLIRAIETDRQPHGGIHDGRAALEMILAVYESHRRQAPVPLPLKSRRHPLEGL